MVSAFLIKGNEKRSSYGIQKDYIRADTGVERN